MVLGAILLLALDFGSYLGTPPQIEIFEDIICRGYYAKLNQTSSGTTTLLHPLDDAICKVAPVQSELALVNGWKGTFDVLPSTSLPGTVHKGPAASANQMRFPRHPHGTAIWRSGRPHRTETCSCACCLRIRPGRNLAQDSLYVLAW